MQWDSRDLLLRVRYCQAQNTDLSERDSRISGDGAHYLKTCPFPGFDSALILVMMLSRIAMGTRGKLEQRTLFYFLIQVNLSSI